jgi:dTMP kinase
MKGGAMRGAGEASGGVFVVLEGIDGAGTSTQAERYASHLRGMRRMAHVTHEPSSGPFGSQIRLVLRQRLMLSSTHQSEVMALLFAADRLDHVECEIAPLLRDGYVVISDRYDLSSIAYQSITAQASFAEGPVSREGPTSAPPSSIPRDPVDRVAWIRNVNRFARRPDVTVVLDVSPEVAASRRRTRGGAVEIYDDADLQARLADAYRRAEDLVPGDRLIHIDGDGDIDAVAAKIAEALEPFVSSRTAPIVR